MNDGRVLRDGKYFGKDLKFGARISAEKLESLAPDVLRSWISQEVVEFIVNESDNVELPEDFHDLVKRVEKLEAAAS